VHHHAKFQQNRNAGAHPALRATLSRKREKGQPLDVFLEFDI
jgi:hypothetical protein